jgi:PPK2 family polyphosphate:nucleotide phosphotransferase
MTTAERVSDLLRLPAGPVDLHTIDTRSTPGFDGGKKDAREEALGLGERLATLQEQLYAEGRTGGTRSLLLVLQGMDTSGKGGTIRHVVGQVDPSGVDVHGFGPPTAEERRHDFLWRVRRQLPAPGQIAVFDRSHYEDVVAVRVRGLADRRTWTRRYGAIERFEAELSAAGTRVVKCFLHISPAEQRERLLARLDDPRKHWKYNPGDLDDRLRRRARALHERGGAVVRRPRGPQVVPQLGGHEHPRRAAGGDGAALAGGPAGAGHRGTARPVAGDALRSPAAPANVNPGGWEGDRVTTCIRARPGGRHARCGR